MEDLLSVDRLLAVWNAVYEWLRTNVFVLDNAVQVGVIVLMMLVAIVFGKRFKPWLERYRDHRHLARAMLILESVAFPFLWFALLWIAMTVVGLGERPNGLLRTATTLLAAWIAIHLASQLVRNRAYAKLISWAAWSIAALSILVGSSRVDLQACKLEYSIVSPK